MQYPYSMGYQPGFYNAAAPDQLAQLRQNSYQQPQMIGQPIQPAPPPSASVPPIIWVQGEEGAKAYLVAAGNSVLLMDSENPVFYIKSSDSSGMPLPLRVFDYSERTAAPKAPSPATQPSGGEFVTRKEFEALSARFSAFERTGTAASEMEAK